MRARKIWNRVAAGFLALTVVVSGGFVACQSGDEPTVSQFSGGAGSGATTIKVLSWNICGDICWTKGQAGSFYPHRDFRGDNNVRAHMVARAVDAYHPEILTLQEVCESQYDAIKRKLVERGWKGFQFKAQIPEVGHCDDYVNNTPTKRKYGVAVFTKAKPTSLTYENIRGNVSPSSPGTNFFLVCNHTPSYSACSTHIRVKCSTAVAPASCPALVSQQQKIQFANIKTALRRLWVSRPVVFAGDLNSSPGGNVLPLYTDFIESDSAQNESTVVVGNAKIDYIFYDKKHFQSQDGDSASAGPGTISDHRLLRGLARRK